MNNVSYAPAPPAGVPAPGHGHHQAPPPQTMPPQAVAAPNAAIQQQLAMQQAQQAQAQQAQAQQHQSVIPAFTPSNGMAFQPQSAAPFNPGAGMPGNNIPQSPNMAPAPTAATPAAAAASAPQPQRSIHSLPCTRCGYPNCDIQILGCNCLLHVRCTPVPIRACPNPRCFNSNPATAAAHAAANNRGGSSAGGNNGSCPLELLPMEFTELDEARRVADLAAKASWRAKEKSRARKKAKLDNGGSSASNSLDGKDSLDLTPSGPPPPPPTTTSSDLRTGRWTSEETAYCDKLIQKFMGGRLPLPEGIKLNEFLSNMLKSKQSRLTKKMKNAKLSSKTFKRTSGYLTDVMEAREFSEYEDAFFHSLQNSLERAEIKFHMQKEWRETFSTYCVSHGQPLNVDRWLASVEEMERRVHRAKDAERMQRRKMMMGCALSRDMQNPDRGVVIEKSSTSLGSAAGNGGSQQQAGQGAFAVPDPMVSSAASMMGNDMMKSSSSTSLDAAGGTGGVSMASPFLQKIMAYIHRHHVPFEYMDAWVPSFVPDANEEPVPSENGSVAGADGKDGDKQPKCRLCFAGSMVAKQVIVGSETATGGQARRAVPLSSDDQFNLSAFGDYSESFSFDVGCGLPGRVYHMGVPTWEQSVHNAPLHHFERVGGSQQWGIRTVVGIPVPSPNVGRIVVVLYSRHDRPKDHDMVIRLTEEFSRLMPSPKWKLIVDVGQQNHAMVAPTQTIVQATQQTMQGMEQGMQPGQQPQPQQGMQQQQNQNMDIQQQQQQQPQPPNGAAPQPPAPDDSQALTSEVISIFGEHMPSDPSNPAFAYLQGFMSLRLLLLRSTRSESDQDVLNTILSSYSSYKAGGRTRPDIALMLARDFMFLNQMQPTQQPPPPQPNNGQQQQYAQQAYAPAPAQMQQQQQQQQPYALAPSGMLQQQQNQMFSPTLSSASVGSAGSAHQMPPPSPHGSSSGSIKMENNSYPQQLPLQQLTQDQPQMQQQYHHQAQYQQQTQQPQQQQYHQQQAENGTNLLGMADLAPMQQDMLMTTLSPVDGGGVKDEALGPAAASAEA